MLMELLFRQKPAGTRKTSVLLFIDSRFINYSDGFGKMFVAHIALAHDFKKNIRDFIHHTVTRINHPSSSLRRHEIFRACNEFCIVLSRTVLNTFTLQMCFCVSARLYLIVSGHCSVQFIRSSRLFGRKSFFSIFGWRTWMQIWMSLTPVSHRNRQLSLSSVCFVTAHISEWQRSHMGSYKTCFSRSTDTRHVKQSQ